MSVEPQVISPEPTDDELLVIYLRTHHATCPACKYDLHQLLQSRCPECGRALSLNVNVVAPYLRLWIATTVILFANAGVGTLLAIGLLGEFARNGRPENMPLLLRVLTVFYLATIPSAFGLLWMRSRFVRLTHTTQIAFLVVICFVTLTGFFLIFEVSSP